MSDDRQAIWRGVGIGGLVLVAMLAFGGPRAFGCSSEWSPMVGHAAPDFSATIAAGDGAGDRVTMSELRGHVVLLDFWASWCPPCRESLPIIGAIAHRHPDLVAYAVNVESEQPPSRVIAAHAALHIGVPTLLDREQRAQAAYDVEMLPTLVLVDRAGVVRHVSTGVPDERALEAEIDALMR